MNLMEIYKGKLSGCLILTDGEGLSVRCEYLTLADIKGAEFIVLEGKKYIYDHYVISRKDGHEMIVAHLDEIK